ncbi:hypothetical protein BI364_12055 [Acidihalobacter yilgarnensis]|uniref:Uncharacterized protein n=1 Tax=Acidihalobacter yilgarnensis TaxID=2819280 RepID=A0A1D8IQ48_9GAMM|nr:hypothetical protein [Acidihalobacter yilgarnensis]AOU98593.1 hypothetical protein BI364_12055 [Acidihalobacter yilgarnensis]
MHEAWKKLDLEGEGLQTLNLRYSRMMRRPERAYALMALFPLGLHRWYLKEPMGALAYPLLCALTPWLWLRFGSLSAAVSALPLLALLAFDMTWVRRRSVALNKALRLRQFMRPGAAAPPPGYRGRYVDDSLEDYLKLKSGERAGHQPVESNSNEGEPPAMGQTPPSFNEQEAMLQELARTNKGRRKSN